MVYLHMYTLLEATRTTNELMQMHKLDIKKKTHSDPTIDKDQEGE